jgi:HD-like signal output (HDOD) protein
MVRLLFVDDEQHVLDGLRLSLRSKRKIWDMVFTSSPSEALRDVETRAVHVVVSDMRMPDMNGAELLARVATLRPEAARVVLSGQMDETAAVRAASVAHRFLTKPCDAKTLEATIVQALELHNWLSSERLQRCIGTLETLPSLPQAYHALNHALGNPETSLGTVARIIESDPGMAAKVLQLVNSSFFGLPRSMVNVAQAVSYLGINTMKSLALADSLFHKFGQADLAAVEREQTRSLLRARIARPLFRTSRDAEAASTAALLLDIGMLALQSRLPAEHTENVTEAERRGLPLHEVERERLGVTHAEVGAYLLGLWGLPSEIINAVARHHAPWSEADTLDTVSAVRVADALVSELLPRRSAGESPGLPAGLLERLGITATIDRLRTEIRASLEGVQ